ncbi:hypothetical protein RJO76_000813 [Aeromonas veronii]|uniref:hypothetical protein n=1 Tax=Aeromonas veronii TaxID=654 RepID=UPI002859B4E7|nr:hypothetical protein [Aeromonas veronii]
MVIKKTRLKKYSELFNRNIRSFLSPGISIQTIIHPVEQEGAVFEFLLNKNGLTEERFNQPKKSVGAVLSNIPQRMVNGNLDGVRFSGTNLYLEGNRILVIKGEDDKNSWSGNAVIQDVERVVSTSMGGKPHE